LGKARKKLEMVERKAIRGNENNDRRRRNQKRKFRS